MLFSPTRSPPDWPTVSSIQLPRATIGGKKHIDGRRVLSRSMIMDSIWKLESPPEEDTIKVHVRSLRRKLKMAGASDDLIETVHGIGYHLANLSDVLQ